MGSGLTGLNSAYQMLKKNPKAKILLEKNNRIGGRVHSINLHHQHSYEAGAIRFYPVITIAPNYSKNSNKLRKIFM